MNLNSVEEETGNIRRNSSKGEKTLAPNSPRYSGWYVATTLQQSSNTFVEPFFPLFARSLGASAGEIGLITGIFSLINISQILWAKIVDRLGKSSFIAFMGQILYAILFLPYILIQKGQIIFLALIRFFQGLFISAFVPSQANLLADHISEKDRGKRVTRFMRLAMIGGLFGTLTGGTIFTFILAENLMTQEDAFKVIFLLTGILGILASVIFRLSVPDKKELGKLDQINIINRENYLLPSKLGSFTKFKVYLKKFKKFWVFIIFASIHSFATNLASPFFIVLEIEFYSLTFFEAAILTSTSLIFQISIAIIIEKYDILNMIGRKKVLYLSNLFIISISFLILLPLFIIEIPKFLWCLGVFILMGIGWGLFNTTMAVFLLDIAHPKYRTILIAFFNTFIGLAMFFSPIIGGFMIDFISVIDSNYGISSAFVLRLILLIFSAFFLIFVTEPEIPGVIFKPIRNIFPQLMRINARGPETVFSYGKSQKVKKKALVL